MLHFWNVEDRRVIYEQLSSWTMEEQHLSQLVPRSPIPRQTLQLRNEENEANEQLWTRVKKLLKITSDLPIRPQMKFFIMQTFIYSYLVDDLKKHAFGATWIRQNLDSKFCSIAIDSVCRHLPAWRRIQTEKQRQSRVHRCLLFKQNVYRRFEI